MTAYAADTVSVVFADIPGDGDGTIEKFEKDADLTNGISVWHGNKDVSDFSAKSGNANFNYGERVFSNKDKKNNAIQIGSGNGNIHAEDVEKGYEPDESIAKGLKIIVDKASYITVYGGLSSNSVWEAKLALLDLSSNKVVDTTFASRPNGEGSNYYVSRLYAPAGGEYCFFIPGGVSGLNVFEIDIVPEDSNLGDVDADAKITDNDAKLILKHLSDIAPLTDEQLSRADVNMDGINALDAIAIENILG